MYDKFLQLNISFHLEIYIWWALLAKNNKIKSGKIYRHKSMHVSRSTKPFTNHSWQGWRSIYNNHKDFKISPTMIWVHREQAMLVDAQSHLHKGTRKNIFWDKIQQCPSIFLDFLLFMWFLDFWHIRKKRLIKNN